jgi:uncharacterized protein
MIGSSLRLITVSLAFSMGLGLGIAHAQAPATPAAPPISITESHLQAGREVVLNSGMSRSFDAILPQFVAEVRQTFTTTRPELTKDLNDVVELVRPELEAQKSDMVTRAARIFANRINEAELKDVAVFFKSTAGKRYVETQPQILDELFSEMQSWTQKLSEFVVARVRVEMKKKGHDI